MSDERATKGDEPVSDERGEVRLIAVRRTTGATGSIIEPARADRWDQAWPDGITEEEGKQIRDYLHDYDCGELAGRIDAAFTDQTRVEEES